MTDIQLFTEIRNIAIPVADQERSKALFERLARLESVPLMFSFTDYDGNLLYVAEPSVRAPQP
ncbi:MAG TPA: hypothetical protein VHW74_04065 [Mycobacteriales bacterium]|jgi:hypothetical protein|nr:hypothetical protein [Mycobacteriales bacterium]